MNEYTKKAVIELENGNYKGYQFYMNLNRRNRSDRQAIRDKWDHEQTRFIKKNYQTMRDEEMAVSLGRTIEAVRCQRKKMKLRRTTSRRWLKKEDEYLKRNFEEKSLKEMGRELNRSPKQVSYRLSKLDISKVNRYDLLINGQHVASGTIREIAEQIGANLYTVKRWRTQSVSWAEFIKRSR